MNTLQQNSSLTKEQWAHIQAMPEGKSVDLQLVSASVNKRVRAQYLGLDGDQGMIFSYPDQNKWGSVGNGLSPNRTVVIRDTLNANIGAVIAFEVKVQSIVTAPRHVVMTSLPLAMHHHDLRAVHRAKTELAIDLLDAQQGCKVCEAVILDLSLRGCRISVSLDEAIKPKLRQSLMIKFKALPAENASIQGTIMNSRSDGQASFFGIKFDSGAEQVKMVFERATAGA